MPTLATPPSIFTHSWSLVYFKSDGYMCAPGGPGGPALLLPLVKRHGDDHGLHPAAANLDLELGARGRAVGRKIRHADRLLQERCLRPAGDDARFLAVDENVVAVAPDRAVEHLEARQLARRPLGLLPLQDVGADERLLLPADDPVEVGLDDRGRLVHVVAVEAHRRLEPQRIPRAEACRHHTGAR